MVGCSRPRDQIRQKPCGSGRGSSGQGRTRARGQTNAPCSDDAGPVCPVSGDSRLSPGWTILDEISHHWACGYVCPERSASCCLSAPLFGMIGREIAERLGGCSANGPVLHDFVKSGIDVTRDGLVRASGPILVVHVHERLPKACDSGSRAILIGSNFVNIVGC